MLPAAAPLAVAAAGEKRRTWVGNLAETIRVWKDDRWREVGRIGGDDFSCIQFHSLLDLCGEEE